MRLATIALLCLLPVAAHGQAFGVTADMSLQDLNVLGQQDTSLYVVDVPEPNQNFDQYLVKATTAGICVVMGVSNNNPKPLELKDLVKKALIRNYGEPSRDNESATMWEGVASLDAILLAADPLNVVVTYFLPGSSACADGEELLDESGL